MSTATAKITPNVVAEHGLTNEEYQLVLEIMGREVGSGIDATCFEALQSAIHHETIHRESAADVPEVRIVSALAEDYLQAA